MTQEGELEVREEHVPLIRPRQEFELLGISERADRPGVGFFHLRREPCLHLVERGVKRAVLEPQARNHAGDELNDWIPQSLLERDICSHAGDKHQAALLDKVRTIIFTINRRLMHTFFEVTRKIGSQAGKVTLKLHPQGSHEGGIHGEMDCLKLYNRGETVGQDILPHGEELAGPVLVGGLPNHKEAVQDGNKAVFVYGE